MKDQHLLITGGAGGLGMTVTQRALERGAHVVVPFFGAAEAPRLEAHLGKTPETLTLVEADLTDETSVTSLIANMPRIDALVHLVGGFIMGPTHEMSADAFREHIDLCLTTTFLCCKHALGRMRDASYGRIVTIGSKAAVEPMGQMAAYSAAKAGVVALTRSIATETKGSGITANCVLPSVIDTPANRASMGDADAHTWVSPASLAESILFLASPAAGDVRGAALPVYGDV